jgi:DNA-directed RNA polymerase subunit RPC12/RpoP
LKTENRICHNETQNCYYTITCAVSHLTNHTVFVIYRTAESNAQAGSKGHPGICNSEETKNVSVTVSAASSLTNSSQCIKNEESALTEIRTGTLKMKVNDTNAVPKCKITSQLSLQGSKMLAIPNTSRLAVKCQEPTGHIRTANIILCSNLNEIIDLKQDKKQTVTSTCEYLSLVSADSVDHKDKHSDMLTVRGDRKNENDNLMGDESYLNCDTESLCLDHAFRETNERIYPCRYCGEMFLVKSNLILHQTTYHSDHPIGCELCGKVLYKSRSEFMEHVCDHHSDNTNSYIP